MSTTKNDKVNNYILYTVSRSNVLPFTSACNLDCVFCSHKQNPPGLEVFTLPHLSIDEYSEIIEFLDPSRKIVIGESSTRIIEGEPFCRKDAISILRLVRRRYPRTPILITTNGCFLDEPKIQELEEIMPLEINVSVNFISPSIRKRLVGDKNKDNVLRAVELLGEHGISFNGSIVALAFPGWEQELKETFDLLQRAGARTLRIFHPGYSKYSKEKYIKIDYLKLNRFVQDIAVNYSIPIVVEPPFITNFSAVTEGVIKGSPAFESGIRKGDQILKVEGRKVVTRVDAFKKILSAAWPEIEFLRNGHLQLICLDKHRGDASGLVFKYDIDPDAIEHAVRVIIRNRSISPLLVTSGMAFGVITRYFEQFQKELDIRIIKTVNNYFGGNIDCAGLMVVADIIDTILKGDYHRDSDLILLPSIAFDHRGRDLTGRSYVEIENALGVRVEIV